MRSMFRYFTECIGGLKGPVVGVEVGVLYGMNSADILCSIPNIVKLHLVDSYKRADSEAATRLSSKFLETYSDKIVWHRKPSVEASKEVEDGSCDFVYLDGGHSYEEVLEDIRVWSPKLKKGGLLGGHDYHKHKQNGVVKAVHELRGGRNICSAYPPMDWWYK